jgi:hypothetical protein
MLSFGFFTVPIGRVSVSVFVPVFVPVLVSCLVTSVVLSGVFPLFFFFLC